MATSKSQLRIIGGKWRGRKLKFLNSPHIRPTHDPIRETLFNWLMHQVPHANCLDLFAGSGALGFEAVSRGADSATLVDINTAVCKQIDEEVHRFGADNISMVRASAKEFILQCRQAFEIIFLDPPFDQGILEETIQQIDNSFCLSKKGTYIYLEYRTKHDPPLPENWQIIKQTNSLQVQAVLAVSPKEFSL